MAFTLRNAYILKVQEFPIASAKDMEHAVEQLSLRKMIKAKIVIATDKSYSVHPMDGIMQIYFDQMNVIAKHLEEIANECNAQDQQRPIIPAVYESTSNEPAADLPPAAPSPPHPPPEVQVADLFTKKQLLKQTDWHEWEQGQLNN